MTTIVRIFTVTSLLVFSGTSVKGKEKESHEDVGVYFVGTVKTSGPTTLPASARLSDVIKASGGENALAAFNAMIVIRFPRKEGVTEAKSNQRRTKEEILHVDKISRDGVLYLFQQDDIIFIPAKKMLASRASGNGNEKKTNGTVEVYFVGMITPSGPATLPARARLSDVIKASGGDNEFAAFRRITLIRFTREEVETGEKGNPRKDEILHADKIPRDGEFYLIQEGDVIFIPAKEIIGQ
jgi:hypothetical protein